MVEADSHLKLLPASILDICKVFEHIDMLSIGIQYQPYAVIPTQLGSDFGALGGSLCWGLYSYGVYGQTISYLDRPLLEVEVYSDKILRGGDFPHVFHTIFLQVTNSN